MAELHRMTRRPGVKGFTLIELIAVIAVIGAVILLIFPRLPSVDELLFNSDCRKLSGLIRYLNETSYSKKKFYRLRFTPGHGAVDVEESGDGYAFIRAGDTIKGLVMEDTAIEDIVLQGVGVVNEGEVAVVFVPGSGAEPFNLHLERRERKMTISYNPYSGKVKVTQGYV